MTIVVAVGGGTYWGGQAWWYDTELSRAERDMAARRFVSARERLARLAKAWPGRDEVEYPLGVCESELGHVGPAMDAWARVPDDSVFASRAALERARLALGHGRLAQAEESLREIEDARGEIGEEAMRLAQQLDLFSGRGYRINRRIERHWRSSRDQVMQLRTHWLYDTQPYPIDAVREALERLGREAPDDDRVWLGKADIATRTGHYDAADAWLTRCEARRPDDPDVWRARLAWALDAGRPDAAVVALTRLPADGFSPAEVAGFAARLAALRGDAAAEHAALERRVALEPGDASAWARLADLAPRDRVGGADLQARARRRKAELDRASDEYRMRMGAVASGELTQKVELARAAEALNRRFEARSWWALRVREDRDDREAREALDRLDRADPGAKAIGGPPRRTLAQLVAALAPESAVAGGGRGPVPAPRPGAEPTLTVPVFRDDAAPAGLGFVYDNDQTSLRRLPETMGGGLGLIDFDGDGWLDIYAVQGGKFPPAPGAKTPNGDRLFRNAGAGTFEDATDRAGIASFPRGFGHGVAVGDYDNDGRPDLFVTRWRSYALYRNMGDGTFSDATDGAGLGGDRGWPTSSAFADLDGDGDLDLYVCHYLRWDPDLTPPCPDPDHPGGHLYCGPRAFESEPDHVFRNDAGRFIDVTEEAGFVDRDGRGLGVVVTDLDGDGRPDVYVANDMTANFLYRNLGGLRFEEVGVGSGADTNASGGYQAGMGVACGDLDGDGRPDLAVTNFFGESTSLYLNLGDGLFADRSIAAGLAAPTRHVLGFGASFLDADNDGRLDLVQANGHVNDYRPSIPFAMPAQLFLGVHGGRLVDVSGRDGGDCWVEPRLGRGLAVGDLDNDGRSDVLILAQNGPLAFFHNLGPGGHFLTLRLEGTASNRDGVGALVRVTGPGRTQAAQRIGGGSFLSASDGRLHFGLGARAEVPVVSVEVTWQGGHVDRFEGLKADAAYHIVEGSTQARPLAGWPGAR